MDIYIPICPKCYGEGIIEQCVVHIGYEFVLALFNEEHQAVVPNEWGDSKVNYDSNVTRDPQFACDNRKCMHQFNNVIYALEVYEKVVVK